MAENIKNTIENIIKDCTPEDRAKILYFVEPKGPKKSKMRVQFEYTNEEFERLKPILDKILKAMDEEQKILENQIRI